MNDEWRTSRECLAGRRGVLIAAGSLLAGCHWFGDESSDSDSADDSIALSQPKAAQLNWLAGSTRGRGGADGPKEIATFVSPAGVAWEPGGSMLIADAGNHTVRRIDAQGRVSTVAGRAAVPGAVDGSAGEARFRQPSAIAVDASGNIFVADRGNHTLRRIAPGGAVTTVAGMAGEANWADGPTGASRLDTPIGMAGGADGSVYVADVRSVRRVAADGSVRTVVFRSEFPISAIAVNPNGDLFVAEYQGSGPFSGSGLVRKFSPDGVQMPLGQSDGGVVRISHPVGLAADSDGNVFVASAGWSSSSPTLTSRLYGVQLIAPDGTVSMFAGRRDAVGTVDGVGDAARFFGPKGIARRADGRLVLVEDTTAIRLIDRAGEVTTYAGGTGSGYVDGAPETARFFDPSDIAADADGVFVADSGNGAVRRVGTDGAVSSLGRAAGAPGSAPVLSVDLDASGRLYTVTSFGWPIGTHCTRINLATGQSTVVTTRFSGQRVVVTQDGRVFDVVGSGILDLERQTNVTTGFNALADVDVDDAGVFYAVDRQDHTLWSVSGDGIRTRLAGQSGVAGVRDGTADLSLLDSPRCVACDADGRVYVVDRSGLRCFGRDRVLITVPMRQDPAPALPIDPGSEFKAICTFERTLYAVLRNGVVKVTPVF